MYMEEAERLNAEWIAKGNPPCDHPKTVRERFKNGEKTGDMACTTCGATWWRS
jgi:hypothetical protein